MHVVNNKKRKTFLTLKSVLTLAAVSVLSMAAFNAHAGFFKLIDRKTDYAAVDGAEVAVVSSDGNYLYVGGTDGHTLSVFSVAATTGKLTLVETLRDGENSVDGISGVVDIEISNNGNYLIVAAYSDETSGITVFTRDIQTGRLNYAYSVVAPNENGFNVSVERLRQDPVCLSGPPGRFDAIRTAGRDSIGAWRRQPNHRALRDGHLLVRNPSGIARNDRRTGCWEAR